MVEYIHDVMQASGFGFNLFYVFLGLFERTALRSNRNFSDGFFVSYSIL